MAQFIELHCKHNGNPLYGDGKSYFLEKFKNTNYVKEHFVFLTIYPVNYQVASNEL